jgi:hypothetical protein
LSSSQGLENIRAYFVPGQESSFMSVSDSHFVGFGRRGVLTGVLGSAGVLVLGCAPRRTPAAEQAAVGPSAQTPPRAAMTVHKDRFCGCCERWAEIAERAGHAVRIVEEADMMAVKRRLGVPDAVVSCHTTEVAGFVLEGHVPLKAVELILRAPPHGLRGIAVPGMPAGLPGMEMPDGHRDPFDVIAILDDGRTTVLQF